MDASFIAPTPPAPTSGGVEPAPDPQGEDAAAFAAHLAPQDAATKPAPRKAPAPKSAPIEDANTPVAAQPASYTLSSPTAPVIVRLNATPGLIDVAFTPAPTTPAPDVAASLNETPVVAASASQPVAAAPIAPPIPSAAKAPLADGSAPPQAAAPLPASPADGAVAPSPAASTAAPATVPPPAEIVAATVAAPPKPATPAEPLRAGRQRGAEPIDSAPAEPRSANAAQPMAPVAAASARNGAGRETLAPASTPASAEAPPPSSALGETTSANGESRRLSEAAPAPVQRAPTPAATVAQHIVRRFDGQATTIEVRLDPAELGAVHVKLDVGADARVTAVVAADNPATLADLMRSARDLERALESAGLELASGGLSFDLSDRRSAEDADADPSMLSASANPADEAEAPAPASRPFGLEAWRGVRVDLTV